MSTTQDLYDARGYLFANGILPVGFVFDDDGAVVRDPEDVMADAYEELHALCEHHAGLSA